MELSKLKYTKGSRRHKSKTYGRGFGSGIGKTSGKGNKGQKQRKSGHVRLGFEGGQTPIYRRVPKVGFNNFNFKKNFNVVTLKQLTQLNVDKINYQILVEKRIINNNKLPVKIIGNEKLTKAFSVEANVFTKGAKKAIEDAKGTASVIKQ
ncbi:MAG: 50S ribosomal protein L15 [Mycoplasmataceae bacterium]|jgi:large subunit ribosomal protein L15|nr:50S ribosomal protein L15 [Mycoplasmataceae bacterium]